jgi:putative DNA primase/helicase
MKNFIRRLTSFIHEIGVMINTPPPAPTRVSAHCTNIDVLLMHLCDFDRERHTYILRWLAYPLRHPGAKMRYGLVIKGDEGTGLNLFFQDVAVALPPGNGRVIRADALDSRFNDGWAGWPLVVVDGSVPRHAMAHVKGLMTSDSVVVDRKGGPAKWVPNRMNFIFMSGHADAIPTGTDRRFMVIEAPPAREKAFYRAIENEIKDGGVDAFRDFLLHGIAMGSFNETTVPPGFERADPGALRDRSLHLVKESA